jgi:hypothetical protein
LHKRNSTRCALANRLSAIQRRRLPHSQTLTSRRYGENHDDSRLYRFGHGLYVRGASGIIDEVDGAKYSTAWSTAQ